MEDISFIIIMWTIFKSKKCICPFFFLKDHCCNPNLGLATKVKAYKGAGQEGSMGVTSHVPGSAKECEGNPHTSKELPLWELEYRWIPESSKGDCRGVKTQWIEEFIISLERYWNLDV